MTSNPQKGTAQGTVGTTGTAPKVTNTNNEHTSEVNGQLPIGASAASIRMVLLPEVANGACLRLNSLPLVPEFVSPFPLPVSTSPLHLVDADLRTDQRLPLVRIQKPEALGKKW